jgi:hypothetical protein
MEVWSERKVSVMARVLKALGVAALGFFAWLFLSRLLFLVGTPSSNSNQRTGYFFMSLLGAPFVALILFLIYFYSTDNATARGQESKTGRTWFKPIRLSLSTVLALIGAYCSFVVIRDLAIKNDHSGGWMISFGATVEAFFLAPFIAIAIFLLAYFVMGLFAPRFRESGVDS